MITRAGRPLVKVAPLEPPPALPRIGLLPGLVVPDGFDAMGAEEIRAAFEGGRA